MPQLHQHALLTLDSDAADVARVILLKVHPLIPVWRAGFAQNGTKWDRNLAAAFYESNSNGGAGGRGKKGQRGSGGAPRYPRRNRATHRAADHVRGVNIRAPNKGEFLFVFS